LTAFCRILIKDPSCCGLEHGGQPGDPQTG
jgi:hypothetical protein